MTVNTFIFFKVTASFPDLASSPSACSAAHLDMRLYDLGGAVPKRFQTETIPAKIVGSKCLATAEYGYHDYLDTPRFEIALGTTPGNANNKLTTSLWNWDVTPP